MTDLEIEKENKIRFIKKFAKLNLANILRKVDISRQAIYRVPCKVSVDKVNKMVEEITQEISDLWEK